MKRLFCAALAVAMLLTACGAPSAPAESTAAEATSAQISYQDYKAQIEAPEFTPEEIDDALMYDYAYYLNEAMNAADFSGVPDETIMGVKIFDSLVEQIGVPDSAMADLNGAVDSALEALYQGNKSQASMHFKEAREVFELLYDMSIEDYLQ